MSDPSPTRYSDDGHWFWDGDQWIEALGPRQAIRRPPPWLTATAACVLFAITFGTILATMRISGPEHSPITHSASPGIYSLRVCNANGYDATTSVCLHDQANSMRHTVALYCSANVTGNQGQSVAGVLRRDGELIRRYEIHVNSNDTNVFLSFAISPNDDLPGGNWSCSFSTGKQGVAKQFRLEGPTADFLYPRACPSEAAQSYGAGSVCQQNQSTMQQPAAADCTAILERATSATVAVTVAYGGGGIEPLTKTYPITPTGDLFSAAATLSAADFGGGATLPTGPYTCAWMVDGRLVGSAAFRVT